MRLVPRGVRARSTAAAVIATAVVIVIVGFASALIVRANATNAVAELVANRMTDVIGQIEASDELDASSSAIEAVGPGNRVFVQVTDARGEFLVMSRGLPSGQTPCSPGPEFLVAESDVTSSGSILHVCAAASLEPVEGSMSGVTVVMAIIGPIVLLGVGIAVWLALGRALKSVEQLRVQAERMGGTDEGVLEVDATGDEVERLGRTLNGLLERLHAQARARRQFVADAGHELRNPLATLRVLLELDDRDSDADEDALAELARLEDLVTDLLTLAKADAQTPAMVGRVDMSALVADVVRLAARTDPRVALVETSGDCVVKGDDRLLRSALDNLLSNARRHCLSSVRVEVRRETRDVVIQVDDDGVGIAPKDADRVFDRFVRLDDARVRDQGGSGLGLAIVRATAQAHGGDAFAWPGPGGHLVLRLPADSPDAVVTRS